MNLYLISQKVNCDYDTFDSAVVAAESEDAARIINPDSSGSILGREKWHTTAWTDNPADVQVQLIGTAAPDVKAGVICASFNAG